MIAPAGVSFVADVGLTLSGQSADYWTGNYAAAVETNPVARPLLILGPWAFVGVAAVWAVGLGAWLLTWRHPLAGRVAMGVALAHATGGGCWLARLGPWGWVVAAGYQLATVEFLRWCQQ